MPLDETKCYKFQEIKESDWTNLKYLNEMLLAFYERYLALNPFEMPKFESFNNIPNWYHYARWIDTTIFDFENFNPETFRYPVYSLEEIKEMFLLKAGTDISHYLFISNLQTKIEELATTEYPEWTFFTQTNQIENVTDYFINHSLKNETNYFNNTDSIPKFTLETFREVAELNESGFRRCVSYPADTTDLEDPAYLYGNMQTGDIFGPWIFEDLKKALSALKMTCHKRTVAEVTTYEKTYNGNWFETFESCWTNCNSSACVTTGLNAGSNYSPSIKSFAYYDDDNGVINHKINVGKRINQHDLEYDFILERNKTIAIHAMTKEQPDNYGVHDSEDMTGIFNAMGTSAIENKIVLMNTISNVTSSITDSIPNIETPCGVLNSFPTTIEMTEKGFNIDKSDKSIYLISEWTFSNSNDGEDIPPA